jgi:hypothetical protein
MARGTHMHKELCTACFYQQKRYAFSLTGGTCIKCGSQTLMFSGRTQIPKPSATKTEWRAWVDWFFPAPLDPLEYGAPDEWALRSDERRALLLHNIDKKKR